MHIHVLFICVPSAVGKKPGRVETIAQLFFTGEEIHNPQQNTDTYTSLTAVRKTE